MITVESSLEPLTDFAFAPDRARAAKLDQRVRAGLASSLSIVFDALDLNRGDRARAQGLMRAIETARVAPGLFGAYVDLVLALFEDRDDDAKGFLEELLGSTTRAADAARVVTLDDAELGPGQAARYRRLLIDDVAFALAPVPADKRAGAERRLTAAMDLLASAAPDVLAELRALVCEIVLVRAGPGPDGLSFGGASTFSLWGALALNIDRLGERLDAAVSLAHETAHGLLFGLTLGGRLVENDDAETYPSPLRHDHRPMEGVAHATYVTARMIHALETMIASRRLDPDERVRARRQRDLSRDAYARGLAVLTAHARFTPAGELVFRALRHAMKTNA